MTRRKMNDEMEEGKECRNEGRFNEDIRKSGRKNRKKKNKIIPDTGVMLIKRLVE